MLTKSIITAAAIALALGLGPATAGEVLATQAGLGTPEATESQHQAGTFQALQGIAATALTAAEKLEVIGRFHFRGIHRPSGNCGTHASHMGAPICL